MKKLSIILFFVCLTLLDKAQAQTSINTTAMPFLLIVPDARAGGMGDIGVATSSDAYSIFHNPAKTAFNQNKISMGINYTPWLRNLTDDIFVGGGSYVNRYSEKSAWGVDLKYFSLGQVNLTTDDGTSNGIENPNELAITGIYSLKLSETFSMGIGLKYIHSNYKIRSNNSSLNPVNSFAVDVSGYYQSEEKNFGNFNGRYRFGFNIANIGPKVEYSAGDPNFIPTNAKIGGGFDFILNDFNVLGLNLEFTKLLVPSSPDSERGWFEGMFTSLGDRSFSEELQETTWALGAEYLYNNAFALRAGYFHESEEKGQRQYFTLGTGFSARAFTLDLSYLVNTAAVNNPLENTLRFSLSFDLGELYEVY
ncbi:type IX secretion system outer membrane channel protein PorV [Tenacibaculum tangerinum]|uniref:Type IX secretion system outer membrane channel protein PorV n=1 Tax=Tenacibaculum tangerinum TaxID=3038772 RepID=A0ABY8LAC2_9FLAO|nr:type IX secretion system outer membrane channel protein PorV [Tenacibaculum tangerinum]WGH76970.1 type IX secretion system outer membrane channel protein PorV [Tenacibaculum tangerinum]